MLEVFEIDGVTRGRLALRAALCVAVELRRLPSKTVDIEIVLNSLMLLEQQLGNLDEGHVASVLQRTKRGRGRPKNLIEQEFELRCILATNALIETGTKSSVADRTVYERAKDAAKLLFKERRAYPFTIATVRRWREDFNTRAKHFNQLASFDEMSKEQQTVSFGYDRAAAANELKEFAETCLLSLTPEYLEKTVGMAGKARFRNPR